METIVKLLANVVVLVAAFKLWLWSRKQAKAGRTTWRRRVGLTFLLAPFLLTLLRALQLPDLLLMPLEAIAWVNRGIDHVLGSLIGLTKEHLSGMWAAAVRPLCYAVVYGSVGFLIGWPLDRWKARREAAAAAAQPGSTPAEGADQSEPSSPA